MLKKQLESQKLAKVENSSYELPYVTISSQKVEHGTLRIYESQEKEFILEKLVKETILHDLSPCKNSISDGKLEMTEKLKSEMQQKIRKRSHFESTNSVKKEIDFMASTITFENALGNTKQSKNISTSIWKMGKELSEENKNANRNHSENDKKLTHAQERSSRQSKITTGVNIQSPVKWCNSPLNAPKMSMISEDKHSSLYDSPIFRAKCNANDYINKWREDSSKYSYDRHPIEINSCKFSLKNESRNETCYKSHQGSKFVQHLSQESFSSLKTVQLDDSVQDETNFACFNANQTVISPIVLNSRDDFSDNKTIILSSPPPTNSNICKNIISLDDVLTPEINWNRSFYINNNEHIDTITLSTASSNFYAAESINNIISPITNLNERNINHENIRTDDFNIDLKPSIDCNTNSLYPEVIQIFSGQSESSLSDKNWNLVKCDPNQLLSNCSSEFDNIVSKQKFAPLFVKHNSEHELNIFRNSFNVSSDETKNRIKNAISLLNYIDIYSQNI